MFGNTRTSVCVDVCVYVHLSDDKLCMYVSLC